MNTKPAKLQEYRCHLTGNLLCKATGTNGHIEIKNPRNCVLCYTGPSRKHQDIWPKGTDFLRYSVDMNCKNCKRFLGRGVGLDMSVEVKCRYCHTMNMYNVGAMTMEKYKIIPEVQREKIFVEIKRQTLSWFWK